MPPVIFIPGREETLPNYARAVRRAGGVPRFSLSLRDAEGCGGLLLPGGGDLDPALYGQPNQGSAPPDPGLDALELALLRRFTAERKPVLGICRGCQAINVFYGGTLHQDIPGHSQTEGRDRLHRVAAADGSLSQRLFGPACTVNSAHHQAVDRLGEGLAAEAWAEDGVVEALRHETLPVWGLQWHPERLPPGMDHAEGGLAFRWLLEISEGRIV